MGRTAQQKKKSIEFNGLDQILAERVGFEPTVGYAPTPDFESGTFDHSATSPQKVRIICGSFRFVKPKMQFSCDFCHCMPIRLCELGGQAAWVALGQVHADPAGAAAEYGFAVLFAHELVGTGDR